MTTIATVLDALADEIVATGLGRLPDTDPGGARPWPAPVWRQPQGGPPAPGDKAGVEADDGMTISVNYSGGVAPAAFRHSQRQSTFDVIFRAKMRRAAPTVIATENEIRKRIADHINVTIGTTNPVRVIQILVWRELTPLPAADPTQGEVWMVSYLIESYQDVTPYG
jgi:hypothetical protein